MSAAIRPRLLLLLALPFLAVQLAAPASASDDVRYPDNPYSGRVSWNSAQRTVTPPPPNNSWHEYPSGPNGPRVVEVTLSPQELLNARNRLLGNVEAQARGAAQDLRQAEDLITDRRRRLSWIEPYCNSSYEHYQAWTDLRNHLQELEAFAAQARQYLDQCRSYVDNVRRRFSNRRPTVVVVTVLNHRNREFIPNDYLRGKAIEFLMANPDRVGSTLRMNF